MKIKLLAVGKMKNPAFAEVAEDYATRIRKYNPLEVVEIPDEKIKTKSDVPRLLKREADQIRKRLKEGACLIALDEKGIQWTSVDLAWEIKQLLESPAKEIIFLIGGAEGLDDSIKREAKGLWSLSKLTLPHQLARVLALEQIYRGLTILRNVPYHNE
ncbi:MAG: 23S rRNA (pseudouridine(1915)-N(3))-methyltransferase RlmH [bacterium]|nr:23S rRNA (pseudouridine(1915)-N(3))-methyltransferase RlmH [bacterium]